MEAAPCGCAAAGRLKLQVERVMGCRRRRYILLFTTQSGGLACDVLKVHEKKSSCKHFNIHLLISAGNFGKVHTYIYFPTLTVMRVALRHRFFCVYVLKVIFHLMKGNHLTLR